jgi:hypothetical protein
MTSKQFENTLISGLNSDVVHTDESLQNYIRIFHSGLSMIHGKEFQVSLTADDELSFLRRLKSIFQTSQGEARVLEEGHDNWFETATTSHSYFDDYVDYLQLKGYPEPIRAALGRDARLITSLLANPNSSDLKSKKGLVVGHVQSGKTGNFIGVASMAADYGYQVIVVLSGIQENLRAQTQLRLDEAFIGSTWVDDGAQRKFERIGVGIRNPERSQPHAATRKDSDFKTGHMNGISLSGAKSPIVFVCKKNAKMLDNLTSWVETQKVAGNYVDAPLLLIDDEADNAGINVGGKDSPTRINQAIRKLLNQFRISTYVGYTATPYANIFIEPPTDRDMQNEDLFPRDFIVALSPPSNYIGAESLFSETGQFKESVRAVHDFEDLLPLKHKRSFLVKNLPDSFNRAIYAWYISCAIRYTRGHSDWHMSMMVNASRFIDVQRQVGDHILAEVNNISTGIKSFGNLPGQWNISTVLRELQSVYESEFPDLNVSWTDIVSALIKFAPTVEVRVINGGSRDVLNYDQHKEKGLHVIAVGGLALSRGFTLEGLSITYILRNAGAYDTLMQMGRWFGYRDDYADLTRVYMPERSIEWYGFVCETTSELYQSFLLMSRLNKKPINFGLCVRHHSSTLSITARNKMKSAVLVETSILLDQQLFETVYLDIKKNDANMALVGAFVHSFDPPKFIQESKLLGQASDSTVLSLLQQFQFAKPNNPLFSSALYANLIVDLADAGFDSWDVGLYTGSGDIIEFGGTRLKVQVRSCDVPENIIRISGDKMRVASRGAEQLGLSQSDLDNAKQEFETIKDALEQSERKSKNISDRFYRQFRPRPLLMLHVLQPKSEYWPFFNPVVALGISIPACESLNNRSVKYAYNPVKLREYEQGFLDMDEDFEDDV